MSTTVWLRISSVIALLFAAGHTLGGRKHWSPMGENAVFGAMRDTHFQVMGVSRSYLDFYNGFGWSLSVMQLMIALLLWQLGGLARSNARAVRPMIAVFAIGTAMTGVIAWQMILPLPALFSLLLVAPLVVALMMPR